MRRGKISAEASEPVATLAVLSSGLNRMFIVHAWPLASWAPTQVGPATAQSPALAPLKLSAPTVIGAAPRPETCKAMVDSLPTTVSGNDIAVGRWRSRVGY